MYLDLNFFRVEVKNTVTGEVKILHLTPEMETQSKYFTDSVTGATLDVINREPLVEWFADHYKDFGAALEFVSNKSQEGSQFVRGFGGIGGILRWQVSSGYNCSIVSLCVTWAFSFMALVIPFCK